MACGGPLRRAGASSRVSGMAMASARETSALLSYSRLINKAQRTHAADGGLTLGCRSRLSRRRCCLGAGGSSFLTTRGTKEVYHDSPSMAAVGVASTVTGAGRHAARVPCVGGLNTNTDTDTLRSTRCCQLSAVGAAASSERCGERHLANCSDANHHLISCKSDGGNDVLHFRSRRRRPRDSYRAAV